MMKQRQTPRLQVTCKVTDWHRLDSSRMGNPAWAFYATTEKGGTLYLRTAPNTSWAYEVTSRMHGWWTFTLDGRGDITDGRPTQAPPYKRLQGREAEEA